MPTTLDVSFKRIAFDLSEVKIIEKAIAEGQYEHLAAMIYEVTPEKAAEIEKIQRQMRPRDFTFESNVQKEFEIWMAEHGNEISPEKEAEFQKRIDEERAEALKKLTGGVSEVKITKIDEQRGSEVTFSNGLESVKGLGAKSIERLKTANILSVDELRKLSHEERIKILGHVVAANLKDLT